MTGSSDVPGATTDTRAMLLDDQKRRWLQGERVLVEEYCQQIPSLRNDVESLLDLIYGEVLLREQCGEQPRLADYVDRFPHVADELKLQFELDKAIDSWGPISERTGSVIRPYKRMGQIGDENRDPIVACPVCHNEIERPKDATSDELVCAACGSSFRLQDDAALDWHSGDQPRKLGKYELIEPVGVGSFGTVYKARDSELDRTVAIKVPRAANLHAKEDLERFLREARSVAQLRHPSIVSVHEIGQWEQMPFLVSEFVQGSTLADILSSRRPAPREAAALVATTADALHNAHEMGVVHRDVKPANIMLDEKGTPRLMDFGLARRDTGDVTMTVEGQVLGTPAYMSPEQARGESRKVDGRTDVYSLGVILYQLLAGELPFRGTTRMLLHQGLHDEPRRPRSLSHLVPRDLETICLRAMAKETARRYATARDRADDLRRFLKGEPIHARPIGSTERLWRWCRRKPALASLTLSVASLLVAIAVGGTIAAFQFRSQAGEKQSLLMEAEENLYFQRISLAHRELTASIPHPARAEELLEACPTERRSWEWLYLKRLWRIEPTVLRYADSKEFNSVAFSHDGTQLAAACGDGKVRVLDQRTGEVVILPAHGDSVFSVAFSPVDSSRLASSGADGHVRVWDLKSRQETLSPLPGSENAVASGMAYSITFSPDGKWLAAASQADTVQVWDTNTGSLIHRLPGHEIRASCVAFSRDGRLLASGSWLGAVRIWDARSGRPLHRHRPKLQLPEHVFPVSCLAFSPDTVGRYLAAGYFGSQVDVWDTTSGKIHRRFGGHSGLVFGLAFHPEDSRRLASVGEDRTVRLWDVSSAREVLQLRGHDDQCQGLAFSPNGRLLASASTDRTIRIWDATSVTDNDRQELNTLDLSHQVWSVAISADGTLVAAGGLGPHVRVWDTRDGRESGEFPGFKNIFSLAFSHDSRRLAAAGLDGGAPANVLKVLDLQTGQPVPVYRHHGGIFAAAFSPDDRWLAFGLWDGSVKLADATSGKETALVGKHDRQIAMGGIRFGHNELGLASASKDGTVRVWDLTSVLSGEGGPVAPGTASGSRRDPPTLAAETGNLRSLISSRSPGIAFWSVAFSPDGRRLVTGSTDGQLTLWDAETGQEIDTIRQATSGGYVSAAFTPNGRWVVSAGENCTVQVLDPTTLQPIHTFRGHLGPIRCLAISPDGNFLARGSTDKTVKLWDLKPLEEKVEK